MDARDRHRAAAKRRHDAKSRRDRRGALDPAALRIVWLGPIAAAWLAGCSGDDSGSESLPSQAAAGSAAVAASGSGGTTGGAGANAATAGSGAAGSSAGSSGGTATAGTGASGASAVAGAGAGGASGASGAGMEGGAGGTDDSGAGCTRELLSTTVDAYFTALAANDPSTLPLADAVKFTENGEELELGEGLWANAGMAKGTLSLYDTELCGTVTQAVVPDGSTDIPLGLRLQLVDRKITEIETIAVRDGDYFVASNTQRMLTAFEGDWEAIVPEAERAPREELEYWMDKYFKLFPSGGCNFAGDCTRMENGFSLDCTAAVSCSDEEPGATGAMNPRIILVDVEAGMAAGFVMFAGSYTDFHMIKQVGGEVLGVYAILGSADQSGWD